MVRSHMNKAMLLTDQYCLGNMLSNLSSPASAYRQYYLVKVILIRIYHKLFFTRQHAKALDVAEYLLMLSTDGILEIDAKGSQTLVTPLVRELAHTNNLKAVSLILVGVTKSMHADGVSGAEVQISPPLYARQKALHQEALHHFQRAERQIHATTQYSDSGVRAASDGLSDKEIATLIEAVLFQIKTKI